MCLRQLSKECRPPAQKLCCSPGGLQDSSLVAVWSVFAYHSLSPAPPIPHTAQRYLEITVPTPSDAWVCAAPRRVISHEGRPYRSVCDYRSVVEMGSLYPVELETRITHVSQGEDISSIQASASSPISWQIITALSLLCF
ncbi:hypothetical protein JZ751_027979 [Albula glossodonta]|uniref:Uncharacterized protein n=1 Tax=Albula glossodonta TaxID=121402 RepID=A0A8T2PA95_9TELE|nr:hypothetical protein JZ751_027979 [Albula glossodonta]